MQTYQNPAKAWAAPKPNPSKEKAWVSFDRLVRIETFQFVMLTSRGPCSARFTTARDLDAMPLNFGLSLPTKACGGNISTPTQGEGFAKLTEYSKKV
jgi:hypothetical protein